MQLTKHRDTFTIQMDKEELIFFANNLGSDPQSTEDQEKVTEWLKKCAQMAVLWRQSLDNNT
jgi:hypothetical protein